MNAVETILSFDGKHVDQLKALVSEGLSNAEWQKVASFFDHENVRYQTASTWIVKTALERSQHVPSAIVESLFVASSAFSDWEAKLHYLQSFRYFDLENHNQALLFAFIEQCENDKKTLVRVWALDTYVRLAVSDQSKQSLARQKLSAALNHKAASMRARARNLIKEFPQFECL